MQYGISKDSVVAAPVHFDTPMQLLRQDHLFSLPPPVRSPVTFG